MVGGVSSSDFDALLAGRGQKGWRGLFHNGKCFAITAFASLGGVLYGYNQGVFGQVQVMAEFNHRYNSTVSFLNLRRILITYRNYSSFPTHPRKEC